MPYNLTYVGNSTSIVTFIQRVDSQLVGGWFGTLILSAIFVILLVAFIQRTGSAAKGIAASSFICFGLSMLLTMLNLVQPLVLFIFLGLAAASVAMLKQN